MSPDRRSSASPNGFGSIASSNLQREFVPPRTHTDIDILVAANIRRRRLELGWPQQRVADFINVSVAQYQKYESARNRLSTGRFVLICKLLGLSLEDAVQPDAA
jgi:hypothetical protein